MRNKHLLASVIAIAVIIIIAALYLWRDVDLQSDFYFTDTEHNISSNDTALISLGVFPTRSSMRNLIELRPGAIFNLNTVTPYSKISRASLNRLKTSSDCRVDSSTMFFFARDSKRNVKLVTKVYIIDMPVYGYTISTDSLGRRQLGHQIRPTGQFCKMKFILADKDETNTLGLNFLSKVALEHNYNDRTISFHNHAPEHYHFVGHMHGEGTIGDMFSIGEPYFVDMKVDQVPFTFILNTCLNDMAVKIPYDDYRIDKPGKSLENYTTKDKTRQYQALVDSSAWIDFGNRGVTRRVRYVKGDNVKHEMNPLTFFRQDVVIDFINKEMLLRSQFDVQPQAPLK